MESIQLSPALLRLVERLDRIKIGEVQLLDPAPKLNGRSSEFDSNSSPFAPENVLLYTATILQNHISDLTPEEFAGFGIVHDADHRPLLHCPPSLCNDDFALDPTPAHFIRISELLSQLFHSIHPGRVLTPETIRWRTRVSLGWGSEDEMSRPNRAVTSVPTTLSSPEAFRRDRHEALTSRLARSPSQSPPRSLSNSVMHEDLLLGISSAGTEFEEFQLPDVMEDLTVHSNDPGIASLPSPRSSPPPTDSASGPLPSPALLRAPPAQDLILPASPTLPIPIAPTDPLLAPRTGSKRCSLCVSRGQDECIPVTAYGACRICNQSQVKCDLAGIRASISKKAIVDAQEHLENACSSGHLTTTTVNKIVDIQGLLTRWKAMNHGMGDHASTEEGEDGNDHC